MAGSEIQQTIYNMEKKKMRKHTLIVGILSFIILLLAGVGFWAYCLILAPDFEPRKTVYVYIDEKKDFGDLCRQLVDSAGCRRIGSFKQLAGMLKYPTNMRTGRYAVEPGIITWHCLTTCVGGIRKLLESLLIIYASSWIWPKDLPGS